MKKYKVVIIGAGTAGLTARREVLKKTNDYIVIDDGPLGTTCARVGCMPSKVLIQAANDFKRREVFEQQGISGAEELSLDGVKVLNHVRALRDRFVKSVKGGMESWQETHLLRGRAKFIDANTVEVNGEKIQAEKFILAVGSRPVFFDEWAEFKDKILTTDQVFEMKELPKSMAIFGMGVIGVELGQAFARLGVKVTMLTRGKSIGGVTDKELQNYIFEKLEPEFNKVYLNGGEIKSLTEDGGVLIEADGEQVKVDSVIAAVGRRSNVDRLDLEKAGVVLGPKGLPKFDLNTLKVEGFSHIFIPGDVNGDRPILHEAADEGVIAGYNAVHDEQCFKRRPSLGITFTDPNIATIGKRFSEITEEFVVGDVSFEGQGRSIVKLKEKGMLKVFVSKNQGKIIGAELFAPDGEHLAHLLAWAISMEMTVFSVLKMPFYHPVIEEGLRTALRSAAKKLETEGRELLRCQENLFR